MANFTEKAIKETFIQLLEEKPLSEITIKDIVEACGINRNSFYYHYQDLPSLIEEIVKEEAEAMILKYPSVNSVVDCFDALIDFASHRKRAIMHIYRSVSREVFERNLMDLSEYFVKDYMSVAFSGEDIPMVDHQAILNYYKCVCFGLVIDWLNNGMTEEYTQSIRKILIIKKDLTLEIIKMIHANS